MVDAGYEKNMKDFIRFAPSNPKNEKGALDLQTLGSEGSISRCLPLEGTKKPLSEGTPRRAFVLWAVPTA
jgi:hypothetical protein